MILSNESIFVLALIVTVSAVLNIILFFKIWGMTNTVEKIFNLSLTKSGYKIQEKVGDLTTSTQFVKDE